MGLDISGAQVEAQAVIQEMGEEVTVQQPLDRLVLVVAVAVAALDIYFAMGVAGMPPQAQVVVVA